VPTPDKIRPDRLRDSIFHLEIARVHRMRRRRRGERSRGPAGRFNRLLHIHPEIHDVEEGLQRIDGLIVAAGASG
jgi:hypothetical protein